MVIVPCIDNLRHYIDSDGSFASLTGFAAVSRAVSGVP